MPPFQRRLSSLLQALELSCTGAGVSPPMVVPRRQRWRRWQQGWRARRRQDEQPRLLLLAEGVVSAKWGREGVSPRESRRGSLPRSAKLLGSQRVSERQGARAGVLQQAGPPASPARGSAAPGQALLATVQHRRAAETDSSPRPGAPTYCIAVVLNWTALRDRAFSPTASPRCWTGQLLEQERPPTASPWC